MKKSVFMVCLTLLLLAVLDVAVASLLAWADERGKLGSVVGYFDYGRSVPGKLAHWEANPDSPGNLYDVGWRSEAVAASGDAFVQDPTRRPTIRSYGMSFTDNILDQAQSMDPDLPMDLHGGPGAPPNFTYALFLDDAQNRRSGDVAVLGILSSSVPALAALSNRTWVFEQPAPFTYPVFQLDGDTLRRIEPLINSSAEQRSLGDLTEANAAWAQQLAEEDLFYSAITFAAPLLDYSPFARLVRRSLAKRHIAQIEADILSGGYPYADVLQAMIATFAQTARNDGQIPIVMLIQTGDTSDADLLSIAKPILDRDNIAYLATAEHFDPSNMAGFVADGHYQPEIDRRFGEVFLRLLKSLEIPD